MLGFLRFKGCNSLYSERTWEIIQKMVNQTTGKAQNNTESDRLNSPEANAVLELIKLLALSPHEDPESKQNSYSMDDNNRGRIYF